MLTNTSRGDVMLVSYRGRISAEGPPACPGADRHPRQEGAIGVPVPANDGALARLWARAAVGCFKVFGAGERGAVRGRQMLRDRMSARRRRVSAGTEIRRRFPLLACFGLAVAVALAGCGGAAHRPAAQAPAPTATRTQPGAADWYCLSAGERREMFVLRGPAPTAWRPWPSGPGTLPWSLLTRFPVRCASGGPTRVRLPPLASGSSPSTSTDTAPARPVTATTRARSPPRHGGHARTVPGRSS